MKESNDNLKTLKGVTHDLNNILTTIVNNVQLLKQKATLTNDEKQIIGIIENSSLRAADIIHDFLTIDSSKSSKRRKVDLSSLVSDLLKSFSSLVPTYIKVEFNSHINQSFIFANYSEIYRVLLNLLVNAKEAIDSNGVISIDLKMETEHKTKYNQEFETDEIIKITIKDNGCGIKKENIDSIFEEGFSTKVKGRQSGIGLNIVKEMINDHGGEIFVNSELNSGTEFSILLPAYNEIEKESSDKNKRILIADDEDPLRESLADLFESYGYKVSQAKDGDEAITILEKSRKMNLLIIDKEMPQKNGVECINEIRLKDKEVPIILVSGVNFDDDGYEELKTIEGKVNSIISKPYDFNYLLNKVKELI